MLSGDTPHPLPSSQPSPPATAPTPVIDLANATIRQEKRTVLTAVHLRVSPGEFVYLVGRTGSGKSSLLKTLYGALPLQAGTGEVAGYNLRKLRRRQLPKLRRRLGIVFQDFNLLADRTAAANLDFVLRATGWRKRKQRAERIHQVLTAVGLSDCADSYPNRLSGGEQQRLAFARALLNEPALLIADEVTGNLDPETSREVLKMMRELTGRLGTAVLFATHDVALLDYYRSRVVRCKGETLVEEG